jgi:undecaprenyl-diphosphatase
LLRSVPLGILSAQVAFGQLDGLDRMVADVVASWRGPAADAFMRAVTFFGSAMWFYLAAAAALALGVWRRRLAPALILLGMAVASFVLEAGLRYLVAHWRPDTMLIPPPGDLVARFELAGFPSGHGIRSAVVFGWLAYELRWPGPAWRAAARTTAIALIALVGVSRVYLNRHWASDIAGSWLVVWVTFAIARTWKVQLRPDRPETLMPLSSTVEKP